MSTALTRFAQRVAVPLRGGVSSLSLRTNEQKLRVEYKRKAEQYVNLSFFGKNYYVYEPHMEPELMKEEIEHLNEKIASVKIIWGGIITGSVISWMHFF
jgi:hypothetical protein